VDEIVCEDLNLAIGDLQRDGFRLDRIYPADDPHSAVLSRAGTEVRLTTRPEAEAPTDVLAPFRPEFLIVRAGGESGPGRAGMHYRDLIPGRLGGRYIASHITVSKGGPVADWVHYHHVAIQLIVVVKGWVRVVYEGQGEPFVMRAGDLVLQPPGIRHRVLESSPGLEVVEISCPAVHETLADHELELPDARGDPDRSFNGQRFLHDRGNGDGSHETALADATGGLASARWIVLAGGESLAVAAHSGELVFGFVVSGSGSLGSGEKPSLDAGDAFVIPPGEEWSIAAGESGLRLLHVTTERMD
jgi:quercetin dioxygenase-like cupin family protein